MTPSTLFPDATSTRSQAGAAARRAGRDFESLILASQHDSQGTFLKLVQVKNFAKRIYCPHEKGGKPEMRLIEERSPFDFCGAVIPGGRGIFFDAKNCGTGYASLQVNNPAIVKPHQINALEGLEASGAIAGFLVRCVREMVYLWLPASRARSPKPIGWDDARFLEFGPIREGYAVPLRGLVKHYERLTIEQIGA